MESSPPSDLKFETALEELEAIVHAMEAGHFELEASIAAYRRGMALMKHCQQQLAAAEAEIRVLEDGESRDFLPGRNP